MITREKRKWLNRYSELMEIVEEETSKAGYWKEKAHGLSAVQLELSGVHSTNKSDMGNYIVKFLDLAENCSKLAEEAERCKKEIIDAIEKIEDKNSRIVLRYRYILFLTYPEIAKRMNYSMTRIYELHRNGLKLLEIPEDRSKS